MVLLARDADTLRAVQTQFAERTVQKTYLAVVQGIPEWHSHQVDLPIGRLPSAEGVYRYGVTEEGKPAQTVMELVQAFPPFCPRSPDAQNWAHPPAARASGGVGPSHRRRPAVHDERCRLPGLVRRQSPRQRPLPRHALHCAQTTIWHPGLERPFTATAPLAPDIRTFLQSLDSDIADDH